MAVSTAQGSLLFTFSDSTLATEMVVEQAGDDLKFTVSIVDSVNTGDLRGVYFHVANESLLSGLSATGSPGTVLGNAQTFSANNVANMGGGNPNINPLGPFDVGVEIGLGNGAGGVDDYQTAMFVLSHATAALDVGTFFPSASSVSGGLVAGVRAQTVGAIGGSRNGSSKLGAGDPTQYVSPPPPGESPEPATAAIWAMLATGACLSRRRIMR
ncbi:hypothetical protein [Pseudobythopirellula maris]|nr:hypothetical protein [Pseudobythopirellula maris]